MILYYLLQPLASRDDEDIPAANRAVASWNLQPLASRDDDESHLFARLGPVIRLAIV
jgi:hypothetical protein